MKEEDKDKELDNKYVILLINRYPQSLFTIKHFIFFYSSHKGTIIKFSARLL